MSDERENLAEAERRLPEFVGMAELDRTDLSDGIEALVDRLRAERDEALGLLTVLRIKVGEWAERINKHDVPDEFVTYVGADQRLLDIIWEMRDAASIERTSRGENA